jgi:small-conductance mechanosensitive channel
MTWPILSALALPLAQGLLISLLLAPFWRRAHFRRGLAWAWLAVGARWLADALGPWLAERSMGVVSPEALAAALQATATLVTVVALLFVLEMLVWDTLNRRRQRPLPRLVWDLVVFTAIVTAVFVVLSRDFGVDLTALLVTSTVLTAVVGLALQDTLRNFIAGVALQVDPPFAIGDWVRLGEHEGMVHEFNWRTLALRTRENTLVHLPNGLVATVEVVNYARPGAESALDMFVGVAYPHPPGEVKDVLRAAAAEAEGVSPDRGPVILVDEYADFAVVYRLRVWLTDWAQKPAVKDAVLRRVWYRLRRAGMVIPFPIRDVNLRSVPEDAERLARLESEAAVFAALRPLALLAPLSDDQVRDLAADSAQARFTAGELLFRQGEAGDSLVLVQAGRLRVDVADAAGRPVTVAHRGPGEYVGEMSLLTGEARSATVCAETEVDAIIVPKAAVAELLLADQAIMEALSDALAARVLERDAHLAESAAHAAGGRAGLRDAILARMRRFFLHAS